MKEQFATMPNAFRLSNVDSKGFVIATFYSDVRDVQTDDGPAFEAEKHQLRLKYRETLSADIESHIDQWLDYVQRLVAPTNEIEKKAAKEILIN